MEHTASWGPKVFTVSPTEIAPLLSLTISFAVKSDSGNDTSGSSATNTMGQDLQSVTITTMYVRSGDTDPRAQIVEWKELVGVAHPLYIGGQRFGPQKLMLKSVTDSDILINRSGKFMKASVSLAFEEYIEPKRTYSTAKTTGIDVASITGGVQGIGAMVTANKSDRELKKVSKINFTGGS